MANQAATCLRVESRAGKLRDGTGGDAHLPCSQRQHQPAGKHGRHPTAAVYGFTRLRGTELEQYLSAWSLGKVDSHLRCHTGGQTVCDTAGGAAL